jgi:hypothetical protein
MSEYVIIGGDGKEYGPVSTGEVGEWVQGGRANGDSKIKKVGTEEWGRLRDFQEFSSFLSPATPPSKLPPQQSSQQPNYPGAAPAPTADQLMAELQGRPHTFSIGDCFSIGWRLTMDNFGLLLLTVICLIGLSTAAALVPFGQLIVAGPLMGGTYYIFLKRLRGEPARVGDMFDGFNRSFLPLFLVYLFMTLILFAAAIPMGIAIFVGFFVGIAEATASGAPPVLTFLVIGLVCLFSMLLMITLGGMLTFSVPLAMDRGMDASEAFAATWRVTKHCWGKCLGLMIVLSLVGIAGFLALCFGMLVTMPLTFAMIAVAYEQLFGRGVQR